MLQTCTRSTTFGVILGLVMFLLCHPVYAGKVRCPVCTKTFPENTKYCPNDGTNLKLDGRPVEDEEPSEEETEEEQTPEKSIEEQAVPEEGDGKYTRHDRGGDRQRTDEDEDGGYSDRRRRIGEERRGPESALEKQKRARQRRREFRDKDDELRLKFEQGREKMWQDRHDRAQEDLTAKRGFENLRKRSLWGNGAPLTSVGVRFSWMGEAADSGPVTGAEIDLNLSKTTVRVGLSTFIGVRTLSERGELAFLENVSVGIQYPWRFSPYVVARGGIGALMSNRFGADITYLIRSVGLESGLDCRVTRSIVITPSLGYVRYAIDDAFWNSFTVKFSVGF